MPAARASYYQIICGREPNVPGSSSSAPLPLTGVECVLDQRQAEWQVSNNKEETCAVATESTYGYYVCSFFFSTRLWQGEIDVQVFSKHG